MVDELRSRMTEHDWLIQGHDTENYRRGKLPTRRLDIPLPETIPALYELSHRLSYISQEIARAARLNQDCPSAISHVSNLLYLSRQQFKEVQHTWETELRQRLEAEEKEAGKVEQIRSVG